MNETLKVVLPSECTDNTIPTETELIFKVNRKGDGSGLAYIGFFQYATNIAPGFFPSAEIIQGIGQIYLDRYMTIPVNIVDTEHTEPTNRNNYFYLKVDSETLYLRFNNANNIFGLHTQGGVETSRNFFTRLSANAPELEGYLQDFTNATRLQRLEFHDNGIGKSFPQYYYGDMADLASLKHLNKLNFDGQKYIGGSPNDLYKISLDKAMTELVLSDTNIKGIISNNNVSGFESLSSLYAHNVDILFNTSFFKNRLYQTDLNTTWSIDNLEGDLSDIPKVHGLLFQISQDISNLIYSRSKVLELSNCRRFYISPKMSLQMYEAIIADLANTSKVTFIAGAVLGIFVVDADRENVSVTTKNYVSELRNKGIVFTTNVTI